eukprot:143837-Pleurochrysis_carterae.AAC.3
MLPRTKRRALTRHPRRALSRVSSALPCLALGATSYPTPLANSHQCHPAHLDPAADAPSCCQCASSPRCKTCSSQCKLVRQHATYHAPTDTHVRVATKREGGVEILAPGRASVHAKSASAMLGCAGAQPAACGIAELEYGHPLDLIVIIAHTWLRIGCLRVDVPSGCGYR